MRMASIVSLALAAACAALSAAVFSRLPEVMAIHWNIDGRPDGFAPKLFAAAFGPVMIVAVTALLAITRSVDPRRANVQRSAAAIDAATIGAALVLAIAHLAVLGAALHLRIAIPRVATGCIGFALAVIGNMLGKTRSNFMIGIRTRWTLSNERVWDRTHRAGGRWFVADGLILIALALLAPSNAALAIAATALPVVTALALVVYSWVLYRREMRQA